MLAVYKWSVEYIVTFTRVGQLSLGEGILVFFFSSSSHLLVFILLFSLKFELGERRLVTLAAWPPLEATGLRAGGKEHTVSAAAAGHLFANRPPIGRVIV